ncbi:hypothetical protein SNE35_24815 [Paucibacter sp. R3-3]|uniref:Uncharacterized protein n=1 Tax=Roseateles agri TaxID=3098619 RepID=A0ABU5DR65_9BURK|nr:hypothetical protein [Paucibacter sp. R3-3]MDY0747749.1 hypothetical protein [Paucibacter sp. R3-3]
MHWVQALVAPRETLIELPAKLSNAVVRDLPQGLALVPITDALAEELLQSGIASADPNPMPAGEMAAGVSALAQELSRTSKVVYVATFIHGGTGAQDAIVWKDGRIVLTLGETEENMSKWPDSSISRALRFAGVVARKGEDEFDALGLGTHRSNEAWASGTGRVEPFPLSESRELPSAEPVIARSWWQFWR